MCPVPRRSLPDLSGGPARGDGGSEAGSADRARAPAPRSLGGRSRLDSRAVSFRGRGRNAAETWQPKLWFTIVVLVLVVGYLFLFAVKNDQEVQVDFVFGTTTTSLIWTVLLSLFLGLVTGVLLSQLYRRRGRSRQQPTEASDAVGDRVDADEAKG